jgi:hypothetical protein
VLFSCSLLFFLCFGAIFCRCHVSLSLNDEICQKRHLEKKTIPLMPYLRRWPSSCQFLHFHLGLGLQPDPYSEFIIGVCPQIAHLRVNHGWSASSSSSSMGPAK